MENSKVPTAILALNLVVLLVLAGLVGKTVLDDSPTEVASPVEVSVQPTQYEFMVLSVPDLEWGTKAQELGQEGWYLAFARRASNGEGDYAYECIFQRQSRVPVL